MSLDAARTSAYATLTFENELRSWRNAGCNLPIRSSVTCAGTASTTSSAPRIACAALSASSVTAEARSAPTPSAREGEKPTTRGIPARRACHASEPPMAPRPITANDEGRTNQIPFDVVTGRMPPPE